MDVQVLDYTPHPYQLKFHQDTCRWRLAAGGRRVGKSLMCVFEALRWALSKPQQLIYWIAPNFKTAREVGFEELSKHFDALECAIESIHYSNLTVEFTNKSKIVFKSGDNPDALRGRKINLVILDEAAFIKPNIWRVARPFLADSGGSAILISTPNGIGDWFHEKFNEKGWSTYHWQSMLNPLITEEEIEDIKNQISQQEYDQEILAKFVTKAGRVFSDFDESNIIDSFVPDLEKHDIYLGMDFGFAQPTAIALIAVDIATQERVTQFDELYLTRTQIDDVVNILVNRLAEHGIKRDKIRACYTDPAGESDELSSGKSPVDSLRKHGFHVINKPTRVNPGLAMVRAYIRTSSGKRRYFVTKNCKETIRSFQGYQYAISKDKQAKEEPLKDGIHDHMPDAVRYFFVNRFDLAKYVADFPNQKKYGISQGKVLIMKRCSLCGRPFPSRTPIDSPPFICKGCKE